MDSLQSYLISVIAAALLCAAAEGILQTSAVKEPVKMICGIVLTITVVSPLRNVDLTNTIAFDTSFRTAASTAAAEGEAMAKEARYRVIKEKTEAYIQDKAAALGAEISADVDLCGDDPPVPQRAVISGQITADKKAQLLQILQTQLGITEENLEWTGQESPTPASNF